MESIERPGPKTRYVAAGELYAGFKNHVGQTDLYPDTHVSVMLEIPVHLLGLSSRDLALKDMLGNGVRPLRPMQGC